MAIHLSHSYKCDDKAKVLGVQKIDFTAQY